MTFNLLPKLALLLAILASMPALAQVAVNVSGQQVEVKSANGGNVAVNRQGEIAEDAQISGVTVINGKVFIDGAKVPPGTRVFTSKKSGKTYRIQWGKDGNVSVDEK